jgi:hypothetical protein
MSRNQAKIELEMAPRRPQKAPEGLPLHPPSLLKPLRIKRRVELQTPAKTSGSENLTFSSKIT